MRGRRRHLQDHERRQLLDEAAGRLCQQHDLLLCELGRRLPGARDQPDRRRSDQPAAPLRRLRAGRTRTLACDRVAPARRSGLSRAQTQSACTSRRDGGKTFTEVWNGNGTHLRRYRRWPGSAGSDDRLCIGV